MLEVVDPMRREDFHHRRAVVDDDKDLKAGVLG
jgi:hypothetical protein